MVLKFEIVEGNLKITNLANGSVVLLFSKQNIGTFANIVVEQTSPVILYNIALGYNGIIFKDTLDNCVDSTETPFTPETWLLFCELNLGFNTPGASGTITVTDSYLTLPAANTQSGKFYWCQNSEGVYLTGLYYSDGTTWETSQADEIKIVANYAALPDPTTVPGQFYWCETSQGTKWLPGSLGGTYYNSGMYYSNGTSWTFLNVPYQATQFEVNAGLNDDKFVTPNTLANSDWSFTSSKVLATLLTGLTASAGTYTATDSILTALNKLKYLLDTIPTLLALKLDNNLWIDFGPSSTIGGFSSISTRVIWYKELSDGVLFLVDIVGTSNSGNFTFTIPFNPNFTIIIPCGQVVNNSITQAAVGTAFITSGSSTITIAANPQGSTFVTAGTKSFKGGFFIKK